MEKFLYPLKKYFKKKPSVDFVRDPEHDWSLMLMGFIIVIVAIVLWQGLLFYNLSQGNWFIPEKDESSSLNTISPAVIKNVADQYVAKRVATNELLSATTTTDVVVDPSR